MQQITKLSSLVIRKIILHHKTINLRIFNLGNYCLQKNKKQNIKQNKTKQKLLYVLNIILGNLKMH